MTFKETKNSFQSSGAEWDGVRRQREPAETRKMAANPGHGDFKKPPGIPEHQQ